MPLRVLPNGHFIQLSHPHSSLFLSSKVHPTLGTWCPYTYSIPPFHARPMLCCQFLFLPGHLHCCSLSALSLSPSTQDVLSFCGVLRWEGVCLPVALCLGCVGGVWEGGVVFLGKLVCRDMRQKMFNNCTEWKAENIRVARQDCPTSFLCELSYLFLASAVLYSLSSTFTCVFSCHEQEIVALCFMISKLWLRGVRWCAEGHPVSKGRTRTGAQSSDSNSFLLLVSGNLEPRKERGLTWYCSCDARL